MKKSEQITDENISEIGKGNIYRSLLLVFFVTLSLMTIYELLKQWISPEITIWESHLITILFSSIVATVSAYASLKRMEYLRLRALDEVKAREIADAELQKSYDLLEEKVKERTKELSNTNNQLQQEIVLRKLAEEEIRKNTELILQNKKILEKKALQLSELNEQLQISESKLREANSDKDKFFSIIAHDLRSPFHSIKGFSEILIEDHQELSKEEIKELSEGIYESSNKILRLLDNLLDWSRVQIGRIEKSPEFISINELIKQNLALHKDQAEIKNIKLEFNESSDSQVFADKNMIDTVLRNLISNALKFTKPNGTIKVGCYLREDSLVTVVEDNGVGIDPANMNKLFRVDTNFSTNGTSNERGTGLGLVLCAEFINVNKGSIWVESQINTGSKFCFSLPTDNISKLN
jgi:signal transduction histidine kinase